MKCQCEKTIYMTSSFEKKRSSFWWQTKCIGLPVLSNSSWQNKKNRLNNSVYSILFFAFFHHTKNCHTKSVVGLDKKKKFKKQNKILSNNRQKKLQSKCDARTLWIDVVKVKRMFMWMNACHCIGEFFRKFSDLRSTLLVSLLWTQVEYFFFTVTNFLLELQTF